MPTARTVKVWSQIHTWTSLACTGFLLFLCLTGLGLVFRDQIDHLLAGEPDVPAVERHTPRASLDAIVAAARDQYPTEFIQSFSWSRTDPGLIRVRIAPRPLPEAEQIHLVLIDAHTASVVAEPAIKAMPMDSILRLHRNLFMGIEAQLFLGVMGLLFVAAIVSGVVLYAPFMRRMEFGEVRAGSRPRRWLDLHNLLGIVTVTWALVVGLTGVMNTLEGPLFNLWRLREFAPLLAQYRGKPPPARLSSVEQAVELVRKTLPENKVVSVIFPYSRFATARHYLIWTKGNTPLTTRIFTPVLIDVETGELKSARKLPWYVQALEVSRPLHFGDYGGLPFKVVWALLDLVTIAVLGSGIYLWFVRRRRPVAGATPSVATYAGEMPSAGK